MTAPGTVLTPEQKHRKAAKERAARIAEKAAAVSLEKHVIAAVPFPSIRAKRPVTVSCRCGWSETVMPDLSGRSRRPVGWASSEYVASQSGDPWQPAVGAFAAHRREVGAGPASSFAFERDGSPNAFTRDNRGRTPGTWSAE